MLEQHEKNGNMGSWGVGKGGMYKADRSKREGRERGRDEWKCIVGKDIMEQLRHSIKLSSGVLSKNTR